MGIRYEGTWEEIAKHADELRGKHVVVVVDEGVRPLMFQELTAEEIAIRNKAMNELFDEMDRRADTPSPPEPPRTKPDEFGDILAEKFRKQGFDL